MIPSLQLVSTWETATIATGCIADAIRKTRDGPAHTSPAIRADLAEAADRLAKAALELRQLLATR